MSRFIVQEHPRGWAVIDTRPPDPLDGLRIVRGGQAQAEMYRDALNALKETP